MIILIASLIGAIIGGTTARRRKGTGADIAQYAFGYAVAFAVLGLIATLAFERLIS